MAGLIQSSSISVPSFFSLVSNKAKHRFESHTTPLCRLLSNLPAVIAVAQRIIQQRHDATGASIRNWLNSLTSEHVLQLSMLADCTDEALVLLRLVDDEQCDSAELGNYVQGFADRIQALILNKLILDTGYTKFTLDMLSEGKVAFFASGDARRLRPCDQEMTDRCLDHMKVWVRLALEVLRTEFPHYGLFSSFGVTSLKIYIVLRFQV